MLADGGHEHKKLSKILPDVIKKGMEDKDINKCKESAMCELLSTGMIANARTAANLAAFMANKGTLGE